MRHALAGTLLARLSLLALKVSNSDPKLFRSQAIPMDSKVPEGLSMVDTHDAGQARLMMIQREKEREREREGGENKCL